MIYCEHCLKPLVPTKIVTYYDDYYAYTCENDCAKGEYQKVVVGPYADVCVEYKDMDKVENNYDEINQ